MSNDTSSSDLELETYLTLRIKLFIFAIPLGPSLVCSIYIFMCTILDRSLRRRSNHIMISIIIIDFIELMCDLVPITLNYFSTGHVFSLSACVYWVTGNYLLQGISSWLMAWASMDRYIIIFSSRNQNTFLRHNVPIILICLAVTIWYLILTFAYTCTKTWNDGTRFLCGGPCFDRDIVVLTADWLLIVLVPTLLIVLFNALLLVRVIFQKYRRFTIIERRPFLWRKNRKLLIQLISIIIVYFVTQCPLSIFSIVRLFGPADFLIHISLIWLFYTPYLIYILVPFAYVATTKECKKRLCKSRQSVEPMILELHYRNVEQKRGPIT